MLPPWLGRILGQAFSLEEEMGPRGKRARGYRIIK
jgi:hypothetical protein